MTLHLLLHCGRAARPRAELRRGRALRLAAVALALGLGPSLGMPTLASSQPAPYADEIDRAAGRALPEPRTPAPAQSSREALDPPAPASHFAPATIAGGDRPASRAAAEPIEQARPRRVAHPGEFERLVAREIGRPVPRYGSALFLNDASGFAPGAAISVPPDYVLNPGDELILGLTGSIEASNLRLVIDGEGRIFLPHIGPILVAGTHYGDLERLLTREVGRQYRNFRIDVTVGRLHGVRVYVTGYAEAPGSYTLSSLSTLVNAALAAGGPSAAGSFRSIQLRRDGRVVADFDLYDLLLKGDKSHDAVLQNEDVLYIGPVGAETAVIGSVNAEAIYEAKPGETLGDLLAYAGGLSTVADRARVLVWTLSAQDKSGWEEFPIAAARRQPAEGGDIVRVLSSVDYARPLERQAIVATIDGEIDRPGPYYLPPGSTIKDLLSQAGGLTSQAFVFGTELDRASLRRQERENFDRAMRELEFMLLAAPSKTPDTDPGGGDARRAAVKAALEQLRNRSPDGRLVLSLAKDATSLPGDMALENGDHIHVPPRPSTVGVFGAVYQSGSFGYRPGATLGDYFSLAGGADKIADRSGIFVIRLNGSVLTSSRHVLGRGVLDQTALPGDTIFVPVETDPGRFWERLKTVTSVLSQSALGAASLKVLSK